VIAVAERLRVGPKVEWRVVLSKLIFRIRGFSAREMCRGDWKEKKVEYLIISPVTSGVVQ